MSAPKKQYAMLEFKVQIILPEQNVIDEDVLEAIITSAMPMADSVIVVEE